MNKSNKYKLSTNSKFWNLKVFLTPPKNKYIKFQNGWKINVGEDKF